MTWTHTYTLLSVKTYFGSDSLDVFSGDAFKCGLFLFVVNEGLDVLFQMKLFFGKGIYTAQKSGKDNLKKKKVNKSQKNCKAMATERAQNKTALIC